MAVVEEWMGCKGHVTSYGLIKTISGTVAQACDLSTPEAETGGAL